jgi:hypothetical protein
MADTMSFRVDARQLKDGVNHILDKKVKALTKNNALYRDISELYAEKTMKYVPCKTGNLLSSIDIRYKNRQLVQNTEAYDMRPKHSDYNYFWAQYTGDNVGDGRDHSASWNRANNFGHKGQTEWLTYVGRNAMTWRAYVKECADIIQGYFNRGEE